MKPTSHLLRQAAEALKTARLLWAVLLVAPVVLAVAVGVMLGTGQGVTPDHETARWLQAVALGMFMTLIPAAYLVRGQMYKRCWVGPMVRPRGYLIANIIVWSVCEGIALLGMIASLYRGSFWPALIPTLIALGVLIINYPNGGAMTDGLTNNPGEFLFPPRS